jgi:hypothetical protein
MGPLGGILKTKGFYVIALCSEASCGRISRQTGTDHDNVLPTYVGRVYKIDVVFI